MTVLPEHFIDVQREDRFCTQCGENLRLACIVVEPHYGMHLIHCPKCAHPEQVELRPLARTAQRWTGLLLALWFLIMLWMWAMTNGAMMGMTIGILEDTNNDLATYIKQAYEQDHPEDAGGIMRTSAQQVSTNTPLPGTISPVGNNIIIPTPPTSPVDTSTDDNEDIVETEAEETVIDKDIDATSDDDLTPEEQELRDEMANINAAIQQAKQLTTGAMTPNQLTLPSGAPGGTVQVIQAGPGRQIIITIADDDLRKRFKRWWAQQDHAAMLAQAGGIHVIPWRELWYFFPMALVPLTFGVIWSVVLLNVSRKKMALALPILVMWYVMGLLVMWLGLRYFGANAAYDASVLLLMPMMASIMIAYYGILMFIGLLIGRPVARGFLRLALSPRACSVLALLWIVDGKEPPRVIAPSR